MRHNPIGRTTLPTFTLVLPQPEGLGPTVGYLKPVAFSQLARHLGAPLVLPPPTAADGRVQAVWRVMWPDGAENEIYDYKVGPHWAGPGGIRYTDVTSWNVSGDETGYQRLAAMFGVPLARAPNRNQRRPNIALELLAAFAPLAGIAASFAVRDRARARERQLKALAPVDSGLATSAVVEVVVAFRFTKKGIQQPLTEASFGWALDRISQGTYDRRVLSDGPSLTFDEIDNADDGSGVGAAMLYGEFVSDELLGDEQIRHAAAALVAQGLKEHLRWKIAAHDGTFRFEGPYKNALRIDGQIETTWLERRGPGANPTGVVEALAPIVSMAGAEFVKARIRGERRAPVAAVEAPAFETTSDWTEEFTGPKIGHIRVPYAKLVKVFGEPVRMEEFGNDIDIEWWPEVSWFIAFDDGSRNQIYDWKAPTTVEENVEWRVTGSDPGLDFIASLLGLSHTEVEDQRMRLEERAANTISAKKMEERTETEMRMLDFLLKHGRSRVHGGHVAMARRLGREGLVRVVDLQPGFAAEIAPGKEPVVRARVEAHGPIRQPLPNVRRLKRRLT